MMIESHLVVYNTGVYSMLKNKREFYLVICKKITRQQRF